MSELEKREGFSRYASMSTEELQEILRKHAHGELQTEPDTEELFEIMEVLSVRRDEEATMQAFRSDEEALAEFREFYMPKEEEKKAKPIQFPARFMRAAAAVLAVVLIVAVTTVTANAFHVDLWGKVANWTQEIFHFRDGSDTTQGTTPVKEHNLELKSLQDALGQYNVGEGIVPAWLPEGYKHKETQVMESPKEISIQASYENNDERLIIKIRQTIGIQASQIEKNENLLEVYVVDGVEYYIFSNTETLQAAWVNGEFECIIGGKITLEEMKMMIDSI